MPPISMPQFSLRAAQAVALCAIVGLSGSACAGLNTAQDAIVIGVDSDSTEQVVLGEIYRSELESRGITAEVESLEPGKQGDVVEALRAGEADLVITCSGRLLESLYPQRARELESELRSAEINVSDEAELSEKVYKEAMGTLPGNMMSVDPSSAQGCAQPASGAQDRDRDHDQEETLLPQNIIPLFRASELSATKHYQINLIGRALDTASLTEMVKEVEDGRPVNDVVLERSWA